MDFSAGDISSLTSFFFVILSFTFLTPLPTALPALYTPLPALYAPYPAAATVAASPTAEPILAPFHAPGTPPTLAPMAPPIAPPITPSVILTPFSSSGFLAFIGKGLINDFLLSDDCPGVRLLKYLSPTSVPHSIEPGPIAALYLASSCTLSKSFFMDFVALSLSLSTLTTSLA